MTKYKTVWLAFVDIKAKEGKKFNDLVDLDDKETQEYRGAWGNILILNNRINDVPDIIEAGLDELGLSVRFIDKIENVGSLIEYGELEEDVIKEVDWLLSSTYVFKISDKIFPYME